MPVESGHDCFACAVHFYLLIFNVSVCAGPGGRLFHVFHGDDGSLLMWMVLAHIA